MTKQDKDNQLVSEFTELEGAVNRSSEHTQRQLESIDSNLLLGSLISLASAFGITFVAKLLKYWIPASFLLICLWALYAILVVKRRTRSRESREREELIEKSDATQINLNIVSIFKNAAPIIKAVSCIYGITFVILAMIANKTIEVGVAFSLTIPVISAVLLSIAFIFCDKVTNFFERGELGLSLREMSSTPRSARFIGLVIFAIVYTILMVVFPFWSLWITRDLYLPLRENILFLLLVLVIQWVTLTILASYFSSISAKKELSNAVTNFASIDYQLSHLLVSGEVNETALAALKRLYLTAKKYELVVEDTFKFINFYSLRYTQVYLMTLKEEEQRLEEKKKA